MPERPQLVTQKKIKTEVQREKRQLKMLVIDVDPFFEVSLSLIFSFMDVMIVVKVSCKL